MRGDGRGKGVEEGVWGFNSLTIGTNRSLWFWFPSGYNHCDSERGLLLCRVVLTRIRPSFPPQHHQLSAPSSFIIATAAKPHSVLWPIASCRHEDIVGNAAVRLWGRWWIVVTSSRDYGSLLSLKWWCWCWWRSRSVWLHDHAAGPWGRSAS